MGCDALKDLVPLHLLDLLEVEEEASLRRHLDGGCPRCASEVAATRQVLDLLPFSLPAEEPSPMVKARLHAAIRKERSAAPRALAWARATAASVAAAIVAALLAGSIVGRRAETGLAGLREQIDRQTEELASLRKQVRAAQDSIRLASAPGVVVADLAGQGERSSSAARVFWDRQRDRWELYAANLPPAGPGKTYQLWLVTPSAKISAGTFEATAEAATGSVQLPPGAGPVVAAAVTDEPAGGSPQPTGSILLLGKI